MGRCRQQGECGSGGLAARRQDLRNQTVHDVGAGVDRIELDGPARLSEQTPVRHFAGEYLRDQFRRQGFKRVVGRDDERARVEREHVFLPRCLAGGEPRTWCRFGRVERPLGENELGRPLVERGKAGNSALTSDGETGEFGLRGVAHPETVVTGT